MLGEPLGADCRSRAARCRPHGVKAEPERRRQGDAVVRLRFASFVHAALPSAGLRGLGDALAGIVLETPRAGDLLPAVCEREVLPRLR